MTTRDEVFKEFGRDEYVPADSWRMADEIVRLRQLLETVEAEREQAYQVAQQNEATARRLNDTVLGLSEQLSATMLRAERILAALREPNQETIKVAQAALLAAPSPLFQADAVVVILRATLAAAESNL